MTDLFILYVSDQKQARDFYTATLAVEPTIDVPGMTEFPLPGGGALGLMPETNIYNLLKDGGLPDPTQSNGAPRAELYLRVPDAGAAHQRALAAGGRELQKLTQMDWGEAVAYSLDPFGHVLAITKN